METNTNEVQATQPQDVNTQEGVWVALKDITVPEDARPHSQEDVESRAISMNRDGQEQNVLLSKEGDKLVLVYGHGRYLSAQKLGWEKLRCDIKEGLSETQKLLLILSENSERENATPFFTAQLYERIMAAEKMEPVKLAEKLGKSLPLISQTLALGKLPQMVKDNFTRVKLDFSHMRELARLEDPEQQIALATECAEKDYSVRELQARVKKLLNPAHPEVQGKEPKVVPDFQFKWKDRQLVIKVRPFRTDQEGLSAYLEELGEACRKYMDAVPAPEPKSEEAPAAIAA